MSNWKNQVLSMPLVVALSSKAIVSSSSSNNQATGICNLLSNQGSDATLLRISTQMHLWLTENCSGNKVISAPHHVLTQGSFLSMEGNICSSIYGGRKCYSAGKTLLSLVSCGRSKFSWQHQASTKRHQIFTWKTPQLEGKNHGPKPPKSSSTIIKCGIQQVLL